MVLPSGPDHLDARGETLGIQPRRDLGHRAMQHVEQSGVHPANGQPQGAIVARRSRPMRWIEQHPTISERLVELAHKHGVLVNVDEGQLTQTQTLLTQAGAIDVVRNDGGPGA
mgnify:CR=1 FL=1